MMDAYMCIEHTLSIFFLTCYRAYTYEIGSIDVCMLCL